ncbi:hypothetical protein GDO86_012183, partial [Hymenochirus boettgeri]
SMSCMHHHSCDEKGTITNSDATIKRAVSCCSNDNCTPPIPTLPDRSYKPNGIVCPSCSSIGSLTCDSTDTVQCTGDEDMCVQQSITITANSTLRTIFHGCATKSYCDFNAYSKTLFNLKMEMKIACTSGKSGLR